MAPSTRAWAYRLSTAARRRPTLVIVLKALATQPRSIAVALAATWLGLALALEFAALSALAGAIAVALGFIVTTTMQHIMGVTMAYGAGTTGALLVASTIGGAIGGAFVGFGTIAGALLVSPVAVLSSLICGSLLAIAMTACVYRGELWMLEHYGYRRLAWEEAERVQPLVEEAGLALGIALDDLPPVLVTDTALPEARAQMRAIVVSRGLLVDLDDTQLAGVLAHELAHWHAGDPGAGCLVWACALPLALTYTSIVWLAQRQRSTIIGFCLWLIFWPVSATIRFVIAPAVGRDSRAREYGADATAASAGTFYRDGLRSALDKLQILDVPRNGWEAALTRTHPPTALRIERLISEEEARHRTAIQTAREQARQQRSQARVARP